MCRFLASFAIKIIFLPARVFAKSIALIVGNDTYANVVSSEKHDRLVPSYAARLQVLRN